MLSWDVALYAVAAIVAVSSLARLMRRRRDALVAQVQRQIEEHRAEQERTATRAKQQDAAA